MKTAMNRMLLSGLLLVLLEFALPAHAFHDPSLGRWLNRDPLGEVGAELQLKQNSFRKDPSRRYFAEVVEGPNLYAFIVNTPSNSVDTDGRGKLSYARRLFDELGRRIWKRCDKDEARRTIKNGGDVRVEGSGSSKEAKNLAKEEFGGRTVRHNPHGEGQMPHYQNRSGGGCHVFYRCTAVGAFGNSWATEGLDLLNPASDINDFLEIYPELPDDYEFSVYTF